MKGRFGEKFGRLGDFLCFLNRTFFDERVERPYSFASPFTSPWRLAIHMDLDSDQAKGR